MKRILLVVSIIWPILSRADGVSVYDFLNIPVGARAIGMGSAFTAVADDPSSVYWNPAGCVTNSDREISLEYNHYIIGIKRGFLAYLHPLSTQSSLGVAMNHLSVGEMTKTNEFGDEIGTFGSSAIATSLAYSTIMLDKPMVRIGATLKWIYQSVDEYSSHGVALDFGGLYEPGPMGVTLGFSVQNIGSQIKKFNEVKESLPLNLSFGGAYALSNGQLILSLDLKKPRDHGLLFTLGSEWIATKNFTFRFGYNSLGSDWKSGSELDILGGLSFGLGLKWKKLRLDISTSPMVELGNPVWIATSYTL